MKKIIPLVCILCSMVSYTFADLALPYEEECAKSIVTQESKQAFETCMQECLKKDADNDWMCQKYSCGGPEVCLYTNKDKDTRSEKYLQAEGLQAKTTQSGSMQQKRTPIDAQKDMIFKTIAVLILCIGVFVGTFIQHKKKKKHV